MSAVQVGDEGLDDGEPVRVRRVFRAVPVMPTTLRERPLGNRDAQVRAYRDHLECLVYESPDLWEPGDEALWDCAPQAYRRAAYAAAQ